MSPACDIDTDIANARCPVRCVASGAQRAEANGHLSWPGSVPAIHVLLAERCSRRGCPRQAGMTNVNRAASASMFSISWQTREFLFPCPGRDAARSDASLIRGATPVQAIEGLKLRAGAHGGQPRLVLSAPAPRISAAPLRAASHPGHSVRKPTAICHGRARPGYPRLAWRLMLQTWMPATSAGMTNVNRAASASVLFVFVANAGVPVPVPGRDAARSDASLLRGRATRRYKRSRG